MFRFSCDNEHYYAICTLNPHCCIMLPPEIAGFVVHLCFDF